MIIKPSELLEKYKKMNKHLFRSKVKNFLMGSIRYILLISLGFVILTQIFTVVKTAITDHAFLGLKSSIWIPQGVSLQSFVSAWYILDFKNTIWFTLINTAILMFMQLTCSAFAGYAFARLKFKGSNLLFGIVLMTIIVPSQSLVLGQYVSFRNFDIFGIFKLLTGESINLLGSGYALYLLAITGMGVKGGLYIYIFRQAFRNLPISIEEAAFVDGAGFLRTFFSIVVPSSTSSMITVGVLSFIWNYADVRTISLLSSIDKHMPLKLTQMQQNMKMSLQSVESILPDPYINNIESPLVHLAVANAGALLTIAPLLVMYLFIQNKFVQGAERSGLGGE